MRTAHLAALVLFVPSVCLSDSEGRRQTVVHSTVTGYYYVRSIPHGNRGSEDQSSGITRVYQSDDDKVLCEYSWYAQQLWLFSSGNTPTLVRLGPWHRSGNPPDKEIEIGFYKDGKVLKEYSALDIAVKKERFVTSVSHYQITSRVKGIVLGKYFNYFEIHTFDGRDLKFDLKTGELVDGDSAPKPPPTH